MARARTPLTISALGQQGLHSFGDSRAFPEFSDADVAGTYTGVGPQGGEKELPVVQFRDGTLARDAVRDGDSRGATRA